MRISVRLSHTTGPPARCAQSKSALAALMPGPRTLSSDRLIHSQTRHWWDPPPASAPLYIINGGIECCTLAAAKVGISSREAAASQNCSACRWLFWQYCSGNCASRAMQPGDLNSATEGTACCGVLVVNWLAQAAPWLAPLHIAQHVGSRGLLHRVRCAMHNKRPRWWYTFRCDECWLQQEAH